MDARRASEKIFFHNAWEVELNLTQVNRVCNIQDVSNTSL